MSLATELELVVALYRSPAEYPLGHEVQELVRGACVYLSHKYDGDYQSMLFETMNKVIEERKRLIK